MGDNVLQGANFVAKENQSVTICVLMYVLQTFEKILAIVCRTMLSEKAVCLKQECLISNH
jgi:hypothetical protein